MTNPDPKPAPRPSTGNPIAKSRAEWRSGLEFVVGVGNRTHVIDGSSKVAPSPVETLLGAVGTCAASDVVEILAKQRTPAEKLSVDVMAIRRAEFPRRVETLELTFTITGPGIQRVAAERAIDLSIQKYCTVAASMAGDITMSSTLVLNGETGAPVNQPMFSRSFKN
ncbi:MAG: OsmC family protein, partial [Gemmatimonadota bacterium]